MRRFLDPHERGLAEVVIPAARFLIQLPPCLHDGDLTLDFISQGPADTTDGVEILELDLRAVFLLVCRPNAHVHIAAHLALLHVRVADLSIDKDLAERGQVGERLLGRRDVGFGDDFHEGGAGPVEIDAAGALQMKTLRDVLLEVDAGEPDFLSRGGDVFLDILRIGRVVKGYCPPQAERLVVLGNLIVFRHVGVVVVLAVELADLGNLAAEHQTGAGGEAQRLSVHDGQRARKAQARGAGMNVRLGAILDLAAAKHLAPSLELGVDFKADRGGVLGAHGLEGGKVGMGIRVVRRV